MYFAIFEMNECFFLPSDGTMMHCARRRRGMVSMAQLFVMELLASSLEGNQSSGSGSAEFPS